MRTFIAIPLPEEVREELKRIQQEILISQKRDLSSQKQNLKVSTTKDFHLTLKFLGDVDEKEIEKIKEALSVIKFNEFELSLDKIGFFPSEDYIRVVWIGLKPYDQTKELQKNQVNELQKKVDSATPDIKSNNKFLPAFF